MAKQLLSIKIYHQPTQRVTLLKEWKILGARHMEGYIEVYIQQDNNGKLEDLELITHRNGDFIDKNEVFQTMYITMFGQTGFIYTRKVIQQPSFELEK